MRVAFIGLGNMGAPMVAHLVHGGFEVTGFDVSEFALGAAAEVGVDTADSEDDAVSGAQVLITMLPNGEIAHDVWSRVIPTLAPGGLAIDCSTIDLATARALHAMAAARGSRSVDAPVSGGTAGAAAGNLTFMCGGEADAIEAARPILATMGRRIVACGGPGMGQAAKICNTMILAASMIAVAEAFTLADRMGLDRQAMFDVVSTSSGACWSLNTHCPVPGVGPTSPADDDYRPGFMAALMAKDLRLAMAAAEQTGAPTPIGRLAHDLYAAFVEAGHAGEDFSAIIKTMTTV